MDKHRCLPICRWLRNASRYLKWSLLPCLAFMMPLSPVNGQIKGLENVNLSGDFRLRFERTSDQEPGELPDIIQEPRYREVVRFRLGMKQKINGLFHFGARLATGSVDDPNTADVTLGDFVNDLSFSLDRVFLEMNYQNLYLAGGKFPNPFLKTDLVWDGDVNPQGAAGSYTFTGMDHITPKFTGIYSIVDEQTVEDDSYMWGGQLQVKAQASPDLSLTLAGAYYDYTIKSLTHADAGDTRSNYVVTGGDGTYLSDFNLFDAIAVLNYSGFSNRYPLRMVGNFVKNNTARVNEDTGFSVDMFLGRAANQKDLRFQYGYAQTETDAILAAFSHDNTTIATNYQQHTIGIDYVAVERTVFNLTLYHYRRNKANLNDNPAFSENDYFTRIRLNAIVKL